MELRPSFFKQADPHFVAAVALSKKESAVFARQVVVHNHGALNSVEVKVHHVAAGLVNLFGVKQRLDVPRILCH